MRCDIERDGAVGTDDWNTDPEEALAPHLADVHCWAWIGTDRETVDGDKTVSIEVMRMMVPLRTDVTAKDQIISVKNRLGAILFTGPLRIETVERRQTHLELTLDRVSDG